MTYRIDYTITRRLPDEEDFAEIGFGSSGAWSSLDAAAYAIESDIQNGTWETLPGQPNPSELTRRREA